MFRHCHPANSTNRTLGLGAPGSALPEFRTRFHYTALNRSVELGRVGFRTAEAAGGTLILLPEARYKTSFYSMLGRVGQTESRGEFRLIRPD